MTVDSPAPSPSHVPRDPACLRAWHWQRQLRRTGLLLALWTGVSFGAALVARALDFKFFGAPFGVWVAGQGALVIFVLIVWVNARVSAREDREAEDLTDAAP
jgi:putative solute:sodium symporter small subunit